MNAGFAGSDIGSGVVSLFVPSSPMMLPEHVGLQDPFAEIRNRCVATLSESLTGVERVVVLTDQRPAGFGAWTGEPLGVRVARRLLELAGWSGTVEVGPAEPSEVTWTPHTLLLVVGDGSAKRTEKAPGHVDERAQAYDEGLLAALAGVDVAVLSGLDQELCDDLWVSGAVGLRAVAQAVTDAGVAAGLQGEVLWSDDPWGVQYWLARWSRRA